MFERFGRKKPAEEVSPGGSIIHRYPAADWAPARIGFAPEATAGFAETRAEVYRGMFGEARHIYGEKPALVPHIAVYEYYRRGAGGNEICTLVTAGMSDLSMKIPAAGSARRVELIFYCAAAKPEYVRTLRWLAHFPHDQKTWIGNGHTVPNGNPPAPFWGSAILDTILFMPTIVQKDARLAEQLKLADDPVHFLWVVPLTTLECRLKLERGFGAILDLFEKNRHPHVFNPQRASYV